MQPEYVFHFGVRFFFMFNFAISGFSLTWVISYEGMDKRHHPTFFSGPPHTIHHICNLMCWQHADIWCHPGHYPVTIQYTNSPKHGQTKVLIIVMNDRFTSISFHVNRPNNSGDTTISNFDLETSRPRLWICSGGKVTQSVQYPTDLLPFHFTSIRTTIIEIQMFQNLIMTNSRLRSWVMSKAKVK